MKYAQLDPTNKVPFYAIGSFDWIIVYNKNRSSSGRRTGKLVDEGMATSINRWR